MLNTITSIVLLLISGGVIFTYITPKYDEITSLRSKNVELDSALIKAKQVDAMSKELSEKMRELSKDGIDRLERLLPEKFDDLRFAYDLKGVIERNGLKVQGITIDEKPVISNGTQVQANTPPGPSTAPSGNTDARGSSGKYITHKFSFSVSTPYNTFIVFLKDLERSLQFIDITSVALSSGSGSPTSQAGGGASQDNYTYTVEFNTYSLK